MIENVVGTFTLPVGVGLNFLVDGKDYVIPMVIEEPSIVAAVSNTAKLVRESGGFECSADPSEMVAQVQLVEMADGEAAVRTIEHNVDRLIEMGNSLVPDMIRFGGGVRAIEVRHLPDEGDGAGSMVVAHIIVDCRDAMGANTVNTLAEGLADELERLSGGHAVLRILSNLADRRLARARCRIPVERLGLSKEHDGENVANNIVWAYRLAAQDPYRAATHNKGIMNGVDAVAIATGNDWRALEAGAHAWAARDGRYRSLTRWELVDGELRGEIELPMAVGTVGGATRTHPTVRACHEILGVSDAATLAKIMAAVGLAQNLGALRALSSEGIQRGHMSLHARQIAMAAGASNGDVDRIASELVARRDFRPDLARELIQGPPPDPVVLERGGNGEADEQLSDPGQGDPVRGARGGLRSASSGDAGDALPDSYGAERRGRSAA